MNKNVNITSAFASVGAIMGIYSGVSKRQPFWGTAGFTILFAVGGAAIGMAYEKTKS